MAFSDLVLAHYDEEGYRKKLKRYKKDMLIDLIIAIAKRRISEFKIPESWIEEDTK